MTTIATATKNYTFTTGVIKASEVNSDFDTLYSKTNEVIEEVNALTRFTDGDKGDVTVSSSGTVFTVDSVGGASTGFRNFIINGNMGVYQRGTGAVTTSDSYGPADRWRCDVTGDTFSTTLGQFVSGDTLFDTGGADLYTQIAVTSVAGASNFTLFQQKIEDVKILAGKTVTFSFWAMCTAGTQNIGISIDQNFGTGGSTVVNGTGQAQALSTTWTKYTKTFTVPSINGKTVGTETTHHTQLLFWLDAGSSYNTRSGSIGQASKTVRIAQVQLEIGSVATPFEFRPYQTELALCRRYCRVANYYIPATTAQNLGIIDMRDVPTITGGGAGFTSTGTTKDTLIAYQTSGEVKELILTKEL